MNKYLLFLFATIFSFPCLFAQDKDKAKMREELQQFKIDFLVQEMQLTEKEKAEFTPLYKEYDRERRQAGSEAWKFERELKKKKDASESDYKRLTELQQKAREKDNDIVKKFDAKLQSFLSAKQIYNMHQGEEKFLEKMKEIRKKNGDGRHNHPKSKPGAPNKRHSDGRDDMRPCDASSSSIDL